MEIRKLTANDKDRLEQLIIIIENNLENREFWLPINEVSKMHFWDEEWTEFYGAFNNEILIAAAALFFNEHEYGESIKNLKQEILGVAEIGRAMVHPDYRGNNILFEITTKLVNVAKKKGIKFILTTIHPENIPSQYSFKKLGMEKQCTFIKSDKYTRDIFLMKLK